MQAKAIYLLIAQAISPLKSLDMRMFMYAIPTFITEFKQPVLLLFLMNFTILYSANLFLLS